MPSLLKTHARDRSRLRSPKETLGVGGLRLGPREKRYLREVIASNRLSYGPFSQRFESRFAREHDFRRFCNPAPRHTALAALKEKHGWADDDVCPSVTFVPPRISFLHNRYSSMWTAINRPALTIEDTRTVILMHS